MIGRLVLVMVASCVSEETPAPDGVELVKLPIERLGVDTASAEEVSSLAARNSLFALDLYGEVRATPGNAVLSPHSISTALSQLYLGAENETEAQMAAALRFELPEADVHRTMNALDQTLALRESTEIGLALEIDNTVWPARGHQFGEPYLAGLAQYYGAGLHTVDYAGDPEGARGAINRWVEESTMGRVPELLEDGAIDARTKLVLANTVYFHGSWEWPFEERWTEDAPFTTLDGRELGVPLMYRTLVAPAVLTPEYDAVELPYRGEEIAFLAIVPNDFAAFESTLDAAKLAEIRASLEDLRMRLFLPRFSIRTRTDLREPLQALGMIDAFTPQADFSAIEPTRSLMLSGAIHEATIEVTEVGTVAAAATGSVFEPISLPPEVRFDRPFVFAIVDRPTGAVLFLGRFVEPQ